MPAETEFDGRNRAIRPWRGVDGARRRRRTRTWNRAHRCWSPLWLGAWELAATHWIDPFFYSKPSAIWSRLVDWFTHRHRSQGSIWQQIGTTLEEALIGFVMGTVAGVVLGIAARPQPFLSDVLAPFIKAANAIPRIVLASLFVIWFGLGLSLEGRDRVRAGVLRGVLQRLPGRP